jgi:hypothetical protein
MLNAPSLCRMDTDPMWARLCRIMLRRAPLWLSPERPIGGSARRSLHAHRGQLWLGEKSGSGQSRGQLEFVVQLCLAAVQRVVLRVFELTSVDRLVSVYDSVEAAEEDLAAAGGER